MSRYTPPTANPHKKDPVAPILPPPCECRGDISSQKRIALHGGVAATLTSIALHCATKTDSNPPPPPQIKWQAQLHHKEALAAERKIVTAYLKDSHCGCVFLLTIEVLTIEVFMLRFIIFTYCAGTARKKDQIESPDRGTASKKTRPIFPRLQKKRPHRISTVNNQDQANVP